LATEPACSLELELEPLLRAVYDDPASDERRAVYADALVERGHPLGELIQIQLRGGEPVAYDPGWWRAIHPAGMLLDDLPMNRVERGFPFQVDAFAAPPDRWRPTIGHPGWATVRDVSADDHEVVAEVLLGSPLPLLAKIFLGPVVLAAIAAAPLPIEHLLVTLGPGDRVPAITGLPRLRELFLSSDDLRPSIERVRTLGVLGRIESLSIWCTDGGILDVVDALDGLPPNVQRLTATSASVTRDALELRRVVDGDGVDEIVRALAAAPRGRFARLHVELVAGERPLGEETARIRNAARAIPDVEVVLVH
jgi:uncharacterized protein (TIGR02996 family)